MVGTVSFAARRAGSVHMCVDGCAECAEHGRNTDVPRHKRCGSNKKEKGSVRVEERKGEMREKSKTGRGFFCAETLNPKP